MCELKKQKKNFFFTFINNNSVSEYRRMEEQYNKESFESLLLSK